MHILSLGNLCIIKSTSSSTVTTYNHHYTPAPLHLGTYELSSVMIHMIGLFPSVYFLSVFPSCDSSVVTATSGMELLAYVGNLSRSFEDWYPPAGSETAECGCKRRVELGGEIITHKYVG